VEYRYCINKKYRIVFAKAAGKTLAKEIFNGIDKITTDPLFEPGMNFLLDFTGLKGYYIDYENFQKFYKRLNSTKSLHGSKIACIVNAGILMGYADMMSVELRKSSIDLAGYQTTCNASEFLGIDCSMDEICSEMKKLSFSCTEDKCNINCRKRKLSK
jgi:hypothetical protein